MSSTSALHAVSDAASPIAARVSDGLFYRTSRSDSDSESGESSTHDGSEHGNEDAWIHLADDAAPRAGQAERAAATRGLRLLEAGKWAGVRLLSVTPGTGTATLPAEAPAPAFAPKPAVAVNDDQAPAADRPAPVATGKAVVQAEMTAVTRATSPRGRSDFSLAYDTPFDFHARAPGGGLTSVAKTPCVPGVRSSAAMKPGGWRWRLAHRPNPSLPSLDQAQTEEADSKRVTYERGYDDPWAEIVLSSSDGQHFKVRLAPLAFHSDLVKVIASCAESATSPILRQPIDVPVPGRIVRIYLALVCVAHDTADVTTHVTFDIALAKPVLDLCAFMRSHALYAKVRAYVGAQAPAAPWKVFQFASATHDVGLAKAAIRCFSNQTAGPDLRRQLACFDKALLDGVNPRWVFELFRVRAGPEQGRGYHDGLYQGEVLSYEQMTQDFNDHDMLNMGPIAYAPRLDDPTAELVLTSTDNVNFRVRLTPLQTHRRSTSRRPCTTSRSPANAFRAFDGEPDIRGRLAEFDDELADGVNSRWLFALFRVRSGSEATRGWRSTSTTTSEIASKHGFPVEAYQLHVVRIYLGFIYAVRDTETLRTCVRFDLAHALELLDLCQFMQSDSVVDNLRVAAIDNVSSAPWAVFQLASALRDVSLAVAIIYFDDPESEDLKACIVTFDKDLKKNIDMDWLCQLHYTRVLAGYTVLDNETPVRYDEVAEYFEP
ncbi:hypothetical protein Q5752_000869 [Cryptotrichosporon argae]